MATEQKELWDSFNGIGFAAKYSEVAKKDENGDPITDYLKSDGDGKDVTVTFTQAQTRENISTSDNLSVMFGKIMRYFADIGSAAYKSIVTSWSNTPSDDNIPSEALVKSALNNCVKKSDTVGLLKNDGTVDTSSYLKSLQGVAYGSMRNQAYNTSKYAKLFELEAPTTEDEFFAYLDLFVSIATANYHLGTIELRTRYDGNSTYVQGVLVVTKTPLSETPILLKAVSDSNHKLTLYAISNTAVVGWATAIVTMIRANNMKGEPLDGTIFSFYQDSEVGDTDPSTITGNTDVSTSFSLLQDAVYAYKIGTTASHPQIGDTAKPIFVNSSGTPVPCTGNKGALTKPVWMDNGEIKECNFVVNFGSTPMAGSNVLNIMM